MLNIQLLKRQMFVVLVINLPFFSFGQITQQWAIKYNGPGNAYDRATCMVADRFGNVYVSGESQANDTRSDYLTIKYNSLGVEQWTARYNGPNNRDDAATSIAIDGNGNVYVTGTSAYDYATIKYNASGVQQWVARFNSPTNDEDRPVSIKVDQVGNVYVTGKSNNGPDIISANWDFVTIKYNALGVQQWLARYDAFNNSQYDDAPSDMVIDASGNVYVTGKSGYNLTFDGEYATVKYNADGIQQWEARCAAGQGGGIAPESEAKRLVVDGLGNVYVTGFSDGEPRCGTIKYNSSGIMQWKTEFGASSMVMDSVGNLYISTYGSTTKINALGQVQWSANMGFEFSNFLDDIVTPMTIDKSGNLYIAGIKRVTAGDRDRSEIFAIKYNSNGEEKWRTIYNTGSKWHDVASIALDDYGDIYVAGRIGDKEESRIQAEYGDERDSASDYLTIKYLPNCGNNENKLFVCHNGKTICINSADLQDHLNHGDYLGHCLESVSTKSITGMLFQETKGFEEHELTITNYPNPFLRSTKFQYELPVGGYVSLKIYDALGREIKTVVHSDQKAGVYNIDFDGSDFKAGVYFYQISLKVEKNLFSQSGKMIVIK